MVISPNIIIYVLAIFLIITLLQLIRLEIRLKKFLAGTRAKNLEETINILGKRVDRVENIQIKIFKLT